MIAFRALRRLSSLSASSRIDSRQLHRASGVLERREDESASIHPTAVVHPDAVIGKGVVISPFCTVGSAVNISGDSQLHPASHITGDAELGSGAIVGADLPGRTIIGSNNVIGHHAVVGVKCQDLKYEITQDVPKYMMVSGERAEIRGLNLEGLRRNGFSSMEVRSMRKAYQKIFMPSDANLRGFEGRLFDVEGDEEFAESRVVHSMVKSIRESFGQSRRGICKFRH